MSGASMQIDLPLTACKAGDVGEILFVDDDAHTACRLREWGIEPGVSIRVAREGSPVILHVHGSRVCLRCELADTIIVRLHPSADRESAGVGSFSEGVA